MIGSGTSPEIMEFESAVNLFYDQVKNKNLNYYELLGLSTTATQREIDSAYNNYSEEFSQRKAEWISGNLEMLKKAQFLIDLGKRAHQVLSDFEKRGTYEKCGFRDVDPQSLKETEPQEKAREIYKRAKNLYNIKDFTLAGKAMEEAIKMDSTKPDYYHLLGLCQTPYADQRLKAEANLKKAAEMEAWNAEHQVALGLLFCAEKLFKKAESYFRKALEIEPNHALANKKLRELAGPQASTMDKVQDTLGKILPTFFAKKKK